MQALRVTALVSVLLGTAWLAGVSVAGDAPPSPVSVTDYDFGDVYLVRGDQKVSYHAMREAWVFNRAMVWLDKNSGVDGAVLCYSEQSPLLLTGENQVSRWYAGNENELRDVDDGFTQFLKKDPNLTCDHATLPSFQFQVEQHPTAELEVKEATHPWQFLVVVKGRGGPPLYVSPWQDGPGKLSLDILKHYREKGYRHHFAELNFLVATWTEDPTEQAQFVFRLRLRGQAAIVPSLPVVRTADRSQREGVPFYAVVLDEKAQRLGADAVDVSVSLDGPPMKLKEVGNGIWKAVVPKMPVGQHKAALRAVWKRDPSKTVTSTLDVHVTDGQFVGYDPKLKLLTQDGKPLGPITGSYRGQYMFRGVGTPSERPLHGQEDWNAAISDTQRPDYGFHWWESMLERELDDDYAYLERCGWKLLHLCSAWSWWARFDVGGRLSPHGAEQLATVCRAAERHGLHVHLALSHYPLGCQSAPYAQYLEAGFEPLPRGQRPPDYDNPDSAFFRLFKNYLAQFSAVFRDETTMSSFTASGESDSELNCGKNFCNTVYDALQAPNDGNHLVLAEPHHNLNQDPNGYRQEGNYKALLGGMRTYWIDHLPPEAIGTIFKLAAMGHIFMAESCFYGFYGGMEQYMNAEMPIEPYRTRLRLTLYTGLVHRNPILLSWEDRVVEDERILFEQVRRTVDWSKPFETPPLAVRIGGQQMAMAGYGPLMRYEGVLAKIPLECVYVWEDDPTPPGTLHTIDARQPFAHPAFVGEGGEIPNVLRQRMPLRVPAGFAASYSWSEDHRTFLALLRKISPQEDGWNTSEGGDNTYVDTTRALDEDKLLETWEVQCLKPGAIQLRIYRRCATGGALDVVDQSEMVQMSEVGLNRFSLKEPIDSKTGDFLGFYLPDPDTEIAAQPGGNMLFVAGSAPEKSVVTDWNAKAKIANIQAFSADDLTQPKQPTRQPASGVVLQNFPAEELRYELFDLATKKTIAVGKFQNTLTLKPPGDAKHLLLLVNEAI